MQLSFFTLKQVITLPCCCAAAFYHALHPPAQEISNTIWASGVLNQKLPGAQLQTLLTNFLQRLPQAKPQHISNCTWAFASTGQQVPQQQMQQLVTAVMDARQGSSARTAAVVLWSAARMGVQIQQQQVRMAVVTVHVAAIAIPRGSSIHGVHGQNKEC
jgi:hypothetical protein